MPAQVIDLQRVRMLRRTDREVDYEAALPWSAQLWPMCRIRYFVRTTASGRPPRCCCGRVYNQATLLARAPVLTAIVREIARTLVADDGEVTVPRLVAALLRRSELTSVERAALNTSPCAACPVVGEQAQQLRFLWGLYRAYWARASAPSRRGGDDAARESRQSAIDLRRHIRQEIALIRHLQERLALCPWARRRPVSRSESRLPGC